MSQYAQTTDLANFMPASLTQGVSTSVQNAHLVAASATADAYLADHFTLPLVAPYPQDLTLRVCQIAYYTLTVGVIGFNPDAGPDQNIRAMYDDAIRWLEGVAAGKIPVQVTDSSAGAQLEGPMVLSDQSRNIEDSALSTTSTGGTAVLSFWGSP